MTLPPDDPPMDDFDSRAAEFVLGTLDPAERRAIEAQRYADPKLAAAIDYWEARLAPLSDSVAPVAPPADLWPRIEARLPPVVLTQFSSAGDVRRLSRAVMFWRSATIGAVALAAALAGLLLYAPALRPKSEGPAYTAAIAPLQGQGAFWLAETQPDGSILVTSLAKPDRPSDKDLELWALAEGATKPVSLGVLPESGRYRVPADRLGRREHLQLLVSLEPKGGSPTGQPTGPVLYGGALNAAG
jgi:anti-sigma-K factor RskA